MKNILSLALLGAIAFACNKPVETKTTTDSPKTETPDNNQNPSKGVSVAIINQDTIMAQYELAKDIYSQVQSQALTIEKEFKKREEAWIKKVQKLEQRVKQGNISQFELNLNKQKLAEEEQLILSQKEQVSYQLAGMDQAFTKQMHDTINGFLERYCKDKPYTVVLSYSELGQIRWADKSIDITDDVLEGLNSAYTERKSEYKKKIEDYD